MRRIVIAGAGQIAEVACYYLARVSGQEVVGFTVDAKYMEQSSLLGRPVIATEELAGAYVPGDHHCFVAYGYNGLNVPRRKRLDEMLSLGFKPVSFVHERAVVWDDFVARENVMILENNTIQPFVEIGRNCILWSGNHIGHHVTIEEDCFVASHVVVSGSVRIGHNSFVGVNAAIRDNVTIGAECIIGAGALVLGDVADGSVLVGEQTPTSRVPSRRVRNI